MKTKTIVTAMLLATAYVLLVNLMFLSGFGKDEMVKVVGIVSSEETARLPYILFMCGLTFLTQFAFISSRRFSSPK
ncbi:hypothetical protein AAH134_23990 [Bacteroides thetaiotaomicron]|uniref:hypothetical protein n=1 Tax=Bacteroides thetaiotaomicron TaxID=818 RepID=UPI0039B58FDA